MLNTQTHTAAANAKPSDTRTKEFNILGSTVKGDNLLLWFQNIVLSRALFPRHNGFQPLEEANSGGGISPFV